MASDLITPNCCLGCRLRTDECVCAFAPRLQIATRLIVITHMKEWRRSSNTGHLARLAIAGGEVRIHGKPHRLVPDADIDRASTIVLFPGRGARALTAETLAPLPRPLTLLVPDGNWNQAKHMMRRVPILTRAHPVRLVASNFVAESLRRNSITGRMSTFEAIAQALGVLEGGAIEERLLLFFRRVLMNGMHNSRRGARIKVGSACER
jgi:DTW domain-containing protein YfiP